MRPRGQTIDKISALLRRYRHLALKPVIEVAAEIAREGAEGRRIGALFSVGDADAVLRLSRSKILDPICAHPAEARALSNPDFRGTIKELAQLDGGFVVAENGTFEAACRYFERRPITLSCRWASVRGTWPPQRCRAPLRASESSSRRAPWSECSRTASWLRR